MALEKNREERRTSRGSWTRDAEAKEQAASKYKSAVATNEKSSRTNWTVTPHAWVYEDRKKRRETVIKVALPEWEAKIKEARKLPVRLARFEGKTVFLYKGNLFTTEELLKPEEARALIEEQNNTKKLKLARAKAVEAMVSGVTSDEPRKAIAREIKVKVWQRDEGRCVECGSQKNLEFDHVIPVSLGGSNTERNLQLLCENCNREKGASL